MENLQNIADECYQEFISDESIIGFEGLIKSKGLGSKRKIRVRNMIYEKYGKENLINIYRHRQALARQKQRFKDYRHSEETKKKIQESNRISWENDDGSRRELSKGLVVKYCLPKSQSDITKKRRVESRRSGGGWKPHTVESKTKMSQIFYQKWKNGDYNNRAKSFSSKSQLELMELIETLGYTVKSEYLINGRPYDIFVKEKNLIIEFNGTYWHLDPNVYDVNFYDKSRLVYAGDIWNRDKEKLDSARKRNYNVVVVWEKDWNSWKDSKTESQHVKLLLC